MDFQRIRKRESKAFSLFIATDDDDGDANYCRCFRHSCYFSHADYYSNGGGAEVVVDYKYENDRESVVHCPKSATSCSSLTPGLHFLAWLEKKKAKTYNASIDFPTIKPRQVVPLSTARLPCLV